MIKKDNYERHLRDKNLSENTISSYMFAKKQYSEQFDEITLKNLRAYKVWLIESYKPKTVNLRLRAINCYLEFIGKDKWKLPFVKVQQKAFLENVISQADYEYFKKCLKKDDELDWYFVVRFLAATGLNIKYQEDENLIQNTCVSYTNTSYDLEKLIISVQADADRRKK